MNNRILIVEDEARLREVLCDYFRSKGELPFAAGDGRQALALAGDLAFDAVLLDIMIPGLDGFSVCRALRRENDVPIIFLTALSDEEDKLLGYELGADDYVTKPFTLSVLYAKTMALIKRSRGTMRAGDRLEVAGITLELPAQKVYAGGRQIALTPKEYALLRCLMQNKNMVMSREQLLVKCWGYDYEGESRAVDTHIKRLREKLSIFCSQYLRCNTAILVLDSAGEILRSSGDFIYFGYQSEEAWQQGEAEAASGMAWIDLSDVADPRYVRLRSQYGQLHSLDVDVIRITGCWDGSRLEPLSLAVLDIGAYDQALETVCPGWWEQAEDAAAAAMPTEAEAEITISADGRSATVSVSGDSQTPPYTRAELDAMGLLAWDVYFDETASAVMPADAVTIYAFSPEIFVYDAGGPVRYQGSERHENLLALLKTMGFYQDVGRNRFYSGASQFSLWNMIVFSSWQGDDLANEDSFGSGDSPSAEYTLLTALQASPLRIAMQFLRNVYLFFTAFALVAFWLLRRSLKKNLTAPLQAVVEGMDAGWGYLPQLRDRPPRWAEPYALAVTHYQQTQHKLRADADEIQRLRTALDYAQAAEAERRRMTSSIAHELKTPLAILHSYAEGLQEHIAEEKRDRYLEVILAESERMDALVLEMLDFSRLEAGKVKLERSEFSLAALSRAVFARLERAAEAKRLQITFDFPTECMVLADESRIAQVIENFATNAIKYTPPGGKIMVRITVSRNGTRFCIANDCAPLSPQALHRVWDSFFRADAARSGEGSGLGLAIAKSIIELHGGHCAVHNTEHGVEFSFMI